VAGEDRVRGAGTMTKIRAVVFDMGGTLEDIYYDEASRLAATRGLLELLRRHNLDPQLDLPALYAVITSGLEAYHRWRVATERELPPERVWTEYVFPHHGLPPDRLAAVADELAFFYDNNYYTRVLRPEVPAVLAALHERGLRLAVISNVISRGQVQYGLAAYGLAHYFAAVVTSSGLGWRKPNPRLFWEAARLMGLPPAACAHVGDTVSRDVVGARRAGYGLAIQIKSFLTSKADGPADVAPPDAVIHDLREIIGLVT